MNSTFEVAEVLGVATLDDLDHSDKLSMVGVLIFNKSVNITDFETEFFNKTTHPYLRIYDRVIDGNKGIYALSGDGPKDPDMERIGLYWLNVAGYGTTATELVLIALPESTESAMMTVLNSVHVENLSIPKAYRYS